MNPNKTFYEGYMNVGLLCACYGVVYCRVGLCTYPRFVFAKFQGLWGLRLKLGLPCIYEARYAFFDLFVLLRFQNLSLFCRFYFSRDLDSKASTTTTKGPLCTFEVDSHAIDR